MWSSSEVAHPARRNMRRGGVWGGVAAAFAMGLALSMTPAEARAQGTPADAFAEGVAAFDQRDYASAAEAWRRGAEAGHPASQTNLARLLRFGAGVDKNLEEAFALFREAAQAGVPDAQLSLGLMYLNGEGVTPDPETAFVWIAQAANAGNAAAQYNLGVLYEHGVGVPSDLAEARQWYGRAASDGHVRAAERLTSLAAADPVEAPAEAAPAEAAVETAVETAARAEAERPTEAEIAEDPAAPTEAEIASRPQAVEEVEVAALEAPSAASEASQQNAATRDASASETETETETAASSEDAAAPQDEIAAEGVAADAPEGGDTAPAPTETAAARVKELDPPLAAPRPSRRPTLAQDETTAVASAAPEAAAAPSETDVDAALAAPRQASPSESVETSAGALTTADARSLTREARGKERAGDYEAAFAIWTVLARADRPDAQFHLARLYNLGEGVAQDRARAFALWRRAADAGYRPAAVALANVAGRLTTDELLRADALFAEERAAAR